MKVYYWYDFYYCTDPNNKTNSLKEKDATVNKENYLLIILQDLKFDVDKVQK